MRNKKAQSTGLITGIVLGVASLIIAVIISFVLTSTVNNAGLLQQGRASATIVNESGYINSTGYQLSANNVNIVLGSFTILQAINGSNGNVIIVAPNITVSASGIVTNLSVPWESANITYSYTNKSTEEITSDKMMSNYTTGVTNVSNKIPQVLLVAGIVLIFGVLVLLAGAWQRMRFGQGSAI